MIRITNAASTPLLTRPVVSRNGLAASDFGPGDFEPLRSESGALLLFEELGHLQRVLMELDKGTIVDGGRDGFFVSFGGTASAW